MTVVRIALKAVFATAELLLPRLKGPRILIYHQVGADRLHEMNITLQEFSRQIDWIQSHGEIVSLEDGLKRRREPHSDRLFVLTFDDGYEDIYLNSFPILARRSIPFTIYLTTGPIENLTDFPDWPGEPLSWSHIRSMMGSGLVTIGAHTHTHPDMRHLAQGAVTEELDRSNRIILDRTGVSPLHFTYPKGWWAQNAHEAVCARYLTATLGGGRSATPSEDPYMLNRIPVQRSDSGPLFGIKMRTGGRIEERIRRRLRRYMGP